MRCIDFDDYYDRRDPELRAALTAHRLRCPACEERFQEYEALARLCGEVRARESAGAPAGLWASIEQDLAREKLRNQRARRTVIRRRAAATALALAATVLAILGQSLFLSRQDVRPSMLLSGRDRAVLDREQRLLERKIDLLEPRFLDTMNSPGDPERDRMEAEIVQGRLDYLDANIERCRDFLRENPLNRGIRGSLVGSQRKKAEILQRYLSR